MVKIVDNYSLGRPLGQGQYGKVYHGTNLETKIEVAIKAVPLSKFAQISKLTELTKNELQILKMVQDNINVIKFVEMMKTNRHVYLVYEYCEGGTLEDFIRNKRSAKEAYQKEHKTPSKSGLVRRHSTGFGTNIPTSLMMPEKEALLIFKQLINAFKSLQNYNILHRDVKPNNIFFKSGHLKLADFGFCKRLRNPDDLTQTSLGSPMYMAPEILSGDVYGSKADIWSVGIVLYELLFGVCPFSQCSIKELLQAFNGSLTTHEEAMNGAIIQIPPDLLNPTCEVMLMRMLERNQFKRISWEDFFYEYQITEYGCINRRQKDFEYDLMKIMKKTSNGGSSRNVGGSSGSIGGSYATIPSKKDCLGDPLVKFDWSKITDPNSSIHSEELDQLPQQRWTPYNHLYTNKQHHHHQTISQAQLDQIYMLKKKTKQFQQEHLKMVELSTILENLVSSTQPHQYSEKICYVLVYNLEQLILHTLTDIQNFITENKSLLQSKPNQNNTINKIYVVFNNQRKSIVSKLQSIRVNIMGKYVEQHEEQETVKIPQIVKYSMKNLKPMRKAVRQYVQAYVKAVPNVLAFSEQALMSKQPITFEEQQQKQFREETLFLLQIIWGVLAFPKQDRSRNLPILNIKSATKRYQISKILNKILVGMKSQQLIKQQSFSSHSIHSIK